MGPAPVGVGGIGGSVHEEKFEPEKLLLREKRLLSLQLVGRVLKNGSEEEGWVEKERGNGGGKKAEDGREVKGAPIL